MANSFCFQYIMESRARFFATIPVFQANCFLVNEIKVPDILALNAILLCFLYIMESRGFL